LARPHADAEEQLRANLVRDPRMPPSQRVTGEMVPDLQPARFTRRLEVHDPSPSHFNSDAQIVSEKFRT